LQEEHQKEESGKMLIALGFTKTSKAFTRQDRPEKVKDIYRALKRDHPNMSAERKARIAHGTYNEMKKTSQVKTKIMTRSNERLRNLFRNVGQEGAQNYARKDQKKEASLRDLGFNKHSACGKPHNKSKKKKK